jgi:hypothetical protein
MHPVTIRWRVVLREAAVVLLFLVLSVAMTWPLAANLDRAISDPGDPFVGSWVLDWDAYATAHALPLFQANAFFPAKDSLALSEHSYGIALPLLVLFRFGVAPLTVFNLAMLLGFASCGYFMYLLALWVTGSPHAAIAAGIIYAFIGIRFHHLPHVQYVWSMWLPIVLLALLRFVRLPRLSTAVVFAAALFINGLTNLHWWALGTAAAALTTVLLGIVMRRDRRFWLLAAGAFAIANFALLPWLLPYAEVAEMYGLKRTYLEAYPNSAEWRDWLVPNLQNRLYGTLSARQQYGHERTLFPGFIAIALCVAALFWRKSMPSDSRWLKALDVAIAVLLLVTLVQAFHGQTTPLVFLAIAIVVRCCIRMPAWPALPAPAWAALAWIVIGAWGARGVRSAFHLFLFNHVSAFRGIRVPARWAMISYVGIALLAAVGLLLVIRHRGPLARNAITLAVCLGLLFELRAAPIRWYLVPLEPRPLYEWIATLPLRGGVLELPMTQSAAYEYMWRATVHHKPLINGVSSFIPPQYERLSSLYEAEPIGDPFLDALESTPCSLVVVHSGWLRERNASVREWLRRAIDSGRLTFVRRFDAGTRADYVFAVQKVEPFAATWRPPETPDPAGRTPLQNCRIFLDRDGTTYSEAPIVSVDAGPTAVVRGKLTISGWALAETGIEHVNLRFDNGRMVLPTERFERPDVRADYPWYPTTIVAGWGKIIDAPPRGIDGDTDLQVEIVDGSGHVRRMPPFFFAWHRAAPRLPWNAAALDGLLQRLGAANAKARIVNGEAIVEDFTSPLLTDAEVETDEVFVRRVYAIVFGSDPDASAASRYVERLQRGTSRERVIEQMVRSKNFAERYFTKP